MGAFVRSDGTGIAPNPTVVLGRRAVTFMYAMPELDASGVHLHEAMDRGTRHKVLHTGARARVTRESERIKSMVHYAYVPAL